MNDKKQFFSNEMHRSHCTHDTHKETTVGNLEVFLFIENKRKKVIDEAFSYLLLPEITNKGVE